MNVRRICAVGVLAVAVPLAVAGCDLVARAGHDLETTGDTITHAAHGTSEKLFGPPVMTEGHSPEAPPPEVTNSTDSAPTQTAPAQ